MTGKAPRLSLASFSPFTAGARFLFAAARWFSPRYWLAHWLPLFAAHNEIPPEKRGLTPYTRARARAIELYVLAWVLLEGVLVGVVLVTPVSKLIAVFVSLLVGLRILDIVQTLANVTVFDRLSGHSDARLTSVARSLVLAFVNFMELVVCFGIVYAAAYTRLHGAGQPLTAFYFSVITQLTIGYGDVYPTGYLRVVAASQGLVSLLFVVLVFARFVGTLPPEGALLEPSLGDEAAEQGDEADER